MRTDPSGGDDQGFCFRDGWSAKTNGQRRQCRDSSRLVTAIALRWLPNPWYAIGVFCQNGNQRQLTSRPATGWSIAGRCQPEAGIAHPRPAPLCRSRQHGDLFEARPPQGRHNQVPSLRRRDAAFCRARLARLSLRWCAPPREQSSTVVLGRSQRGRGAGP